MTDHRVNWQEVAGLTFAPATDQLWRQTPTPFVARYQPLGVPLEFATNASVLAEMAADSFGPWGTPAPHAPALRLNFFLHTAPAAPDAPGRPTPVFRAQDDYFMLSVGSSLGLADRARGFGMAFITPDLLADRLFVQEGFLECLGLFLTTRHRRAVLHAAGLIHNGRAVLLTGHSGAGKSTLAFACLRAGFQLLAEDVIYLDETSSPLQAWGAPWRLHLLPDGERFFPELAAWPLVTQLNGETKRRVEVNQQWPGAAVPLAPVMGVIALARAPGVASAWQAVDPAALRNSLIGFGDQMGADSLTAMHAATDRLLAGRVATLAVGSDLAAAVALIREWMDAG
ncbi:hypothetical protein [Candidatus Amarolinea dominans]|uniref:hypothetical protein n=1 Tax=Candidatus Amarolinea dominans TaxID=3140696 RepID=UPI003135E2E4|nr:hypothetical protein [Anaerolineae bacterium]